jgi:hypothetical protein
MEPICTRVTPETLPELLMRLEAETMADCLWLKGIDSIDWVILDGHQIMWADEASSEEMKMHRDIVTWNEFIRRVKEACPK